jgi:drug/metabolite transporter (DMT)-like permease
VVGRPRARLAAGGSGRHGRLILVARAKAVLAGYAPDLALIGIAAVWGLTFVTVKQSLAQTTPFVFLAARFWLAAAVFAALVKSSRRGWDRGLLAAGGIAGTFFFAGYAFQTTGLALTTASNAGFITGLFVVFTPIFASVFLRRPPHAGGIVGVVAATVGLLLLTGGWRGHVGLGDLLVLGCAVAFALHIITLSRYSADVGWAPLALSQMLVVAAGSSIAALVLEPASLIGTLDGAARFLASLWVTPLFSLSEFARDKVTFAVVLTAVLATSVALSVQTWAQTRIGPTRTALILIMEPVFAGVFASLVLHERLGLAGWIGSGLILAGMLTSEVSRVVRDREASAAAGDE